MNESMSERLTLALLWTVRAHAGTVRDGKSPLPYATHPIDVCNKLRYIGRVTQEPILIASLLHDTLEETSVTPTEIEDTFGPVVSDLVIQLTRMEPSAAIAESLDEDELYALRTQMLLDGIRQMSPEAQTIKLADRLSNLESARVTRSPKKWHRYLAQSEQLLEIIPKKVNAWLWEAVESEIVRR
jgi:(p)ppGpp synthase/HD superfamily hydrolase